MIIRKEKQTFNQMNRQRAVIYELFAMVFLKEPVAAYLEKMGTVLPELQNILSVEGIISTTCDLEEIKQEYYDRIFVPTSGRYVPPFETAIINRELKGAKLVYGSLNTALTKHVEGCYKQVNFNPLQLEIFDPIRGVRFADFIGFELAFMSYLCYAQEKSENGLDAPWHNLQKSFLEQHLANWCQDYAELMQNNTDDFFPLIMKVISAWVKWDLKVLQGTGNE